ncbi:hypothetical protein HMPREF9088_1900 [Enterococcus italicus DSM 15952]|uniref:Uncharacterized protein n=1 Tax=Enterococcus italicus (strain DSM 15952 / CCUG 50447 / LMG 22039 / TP 1.5) TaxID=888064 RepID=E6LHR0_ENTI1|nr:hypothetical protein HMPREF9088_1900 [Enterococcus italicus DSM 15952]
MKRKTNKTLHFNCDLINFSINCLLLFFSSWPSNQKILCKRTKLSNHQKKTAEFS